MQTVTIDPPEPHSDKQRLIMSAFQIPGLREMWVCAGSKSGKTLAASTAQIIGGINKPKSKWRWVAPIYEQATVGMEYFTSILPPPPHTEINRSKLRITMPMIGVEWQFWHAQDPKSLEGPAIDGYVFDEAAKMPAEARSSARTTTTVTKGPHVYISYPFGKNWFYDGCMEAKEHMRWAKANDKPYEKLFIHARSIDNPMVDPQVIENARRELPDRLFRQFYLAEFVDDGTMFSGFRDCQTGKVLDFHNVNSQHYVDQTAKGRQVVVGADWGKTEDYTVFFAIDAETRRVVAFRRFYRKPYTEAIRELVLFCRDFDVLVVRHDKTGVGMAIDDQLAYTDLPAEGITFTNATKAEMVARLMTSFERRMIQIPRWSTLETELDAFTVTTSAIGTMSYSAPSGKHDDTVCALMLANAALLQYGEVESEVRFLDEIKAEPKPASGSLEEFYQGLVTDSDD